jgi:ribosomal protein S27E
MGKIASKKTIVDGHEFDSQTEAEYYEYLKGRDDVKDIVLQPRFTLMNHFQIRCSRCEGGHVISSKTGNVIQCKTCRGTGCRDRQAWTYKADFEVLYDTGKVEVVDVKGWANENFRLVRKMFEYTQGFELLVVKKSKGGWKYA